MEVRALASNQPIAPRKARLVLNAIRGRGVVEALGVLEYMPQQTARIVSKLVRSAAANAENNHNLNPDRLIVKRAVADDARTLVMAGLLATGSPPRTIKLNELASSRAAATPKKQVAQEYVEICTNPSFSESGRCRAATPGRELNRAGQELGRLVRNWLALRRPPGRPYLRGPERKP